MKRSWKWTAIAGCILATGSAFVAGRSWADGIPATNALAYSGRLEAPSGDALEGSYNLEVKFWGSESGGSSPLCTSNSQPITLQQGRFTVTLPDECTDAVQVEADVWVEILVDGSSLGRTKTGAVPYAVEASHATASDSANTLGTLAPGDVQRRVTGGCANANQSIKTINADGTVSCETDDSSAYTGSNGVTVSGTAISADTSYVQRRTNQLSASCAGTNQSIKTISALGEVTCETDENTTYAAGSGISVANNTIAIVSNSVTRTHLAGTEIAIYQQAAGCGGGLTTSTSCTTLPCAHTSGIDLLNFRNCAGTTCASAATSLCTGLSQVGWLIP